MLREMEISATLSSMKRERKLNKLEHFLETEKIYFMTHFPTENTRKAAKDGHKVIRSI